MGNLISLVADVNESFLKVLELSITIKVRSRKILRINEISNYLVKHKSIIS